MSRHLQSMLEREATGAKRAFEATQRQAFLDEIRKFGGTNARALSVSCGDGIWDYLALGSDTGISKITATDIVTCPVRGHDIATIHTRGEWDFVRVEPDKPLPFDDGSFDLVYHMDVVEHTEKPHTFLSEQFRVLKKGGRIIVGTPNLLRPMNVLKLLIGRLKFPHEMGYNEEIGAYTHVQEFHEAQLELLLKETGFTSVEVAPIFFGVQPLNIRLRSQPTSRFAQTLCQFLIATGWKETAGGASIA